MTSSPEFEPQKAVRWLAPSELGSAAFRVGLSSVFGEYADKRELEALRPPSEHRLSGDVRLDYVADVGDGFAATYAVARALGAESLETDQGALPRGRILVFGGDAVYPTASAEEYKNRTVGPYRAALDETVAPHPQLYAIPGNHDWYDGLTSFVRLFCDGDWLGGWSLPQERSYFSVRLGERWWLWGIDIQFDGYIDTPQLDFFKDVGESVQPGDGIILATAKPAWVKARPEDSERPTPSMRNIDYFIRECVPEGANVRLTVAGDLHHYSRYESTADGSQFVTAGGGGAYLSATHHLDESLDLKARGPEDDRHLECRGVYPDRRWSWRRRWTSPAIGWRNPSFTLLLAALYTLLGSIAAASTANRQQSFGATLVDLKDEAWWFSPAEVTRSLFSSAGGVLVALFVILSLALFSQASSWWKKGLVGVLHSLLHFAALVFVVAFSSQVLLGDSQTVAIIQYFIMVFVLGGVAGVLVFSVYLGLADLGGLNTNELFAGLRMRDRKCFLRMSIDADSITCRAIGLDRVPRAKRWRSRTPSPMDEPALDLDMTPEEAEGYAPRVIEQFEINRQPPTVDPDG